MQSRADTNSRYSLTHISGRMQHCASSKTVTMQAGRSCKLTPAFCAQQCQHGLAPLSGRQNLPGWQNLEALGSLETHQAKLCPPAMPQIPPVCAHQSQKLAELQQGCLTELLLLMLALRLTLLVSQPEQTCRGVKCLTCDCEGSQCSGVIFCRLQCPYRCWG